VSRYSDDLESGLRAYRKTAIRPETAPPGRLRRSRLGPKPASRSPPRVRSPIAGWVAVLGKMGPVPIVMVEIKADHTASYTHGHDFRILTGGARR
jgi:hypothetical protein